MKETDAGPVGNDNRRNNILTPFCFGGAGPPKYVLLEFSSYLPGAEVSDLPFVPSIHPNTSALCLSPRSSSCLQALENRVRCPSRNTVCVYLFVCLFLIGMLWRLPGLFVYFLNLPGEVSGRKHLLSKLGQGHGLAGNWGDLCMKKQEVKRGVRPRAKDLALLYNVVIRQGQKQPENQKQALPTTQFKP